MAPSLLELAAKRLGADDLLKLLHDLPPEVKRLVLYQWDFWARPEQLLPDDKRICLLLAGRRFGKTRTAAEWVRRRVEAGIARQLILVAPTHNDMLTDMLYGPSGL